LDSSQMSPPLPPSPPEGPPRGTYFSRRKARQPLPPPPPFTRILASSTNTDRSRCGPVRMEHTPCLRGKQKYAPSSGRVSPFSSQWPVSMGSWRRARLCFGSGFRLFLRQYADKAPHAAFIFEPHHARDPGKERIILRAAHVPAGLVARSALADQDAAAGHKLPAEALDSQPLPVRIAAVCRGAAALLMCHGKTPMLALC